MRVWDLGHAVEEVETWNYALLICLHQHRMQLFAGIRREYTFPVQHAIVAMRFFGVEETSYAPTAASSHGSCAVAPRSSGSGSIHDSRPTAVFTITTSATPFMP